MTQTLILEVKISISKDNKILINNTILQIHFYKYKYELSLKCMYVYKVLCLDYMRRALFDAFMQVCSEGYQEEGAFL